MLWNILWKATNNRERRVSPRFRRQKATAALHGPGETAEAAGTFQSCRDLSDNTVL